MTKPYSKKSFKKDYGTPIATAKKHWVVYILPLLLIASGIALLGSNEISIKVTGGILILGSLLRAIQIAGEKWHLTKDHLFIERGMGPKKTYQKVPVTDLYRSSTSTNKIGRALNFGSVTAKRRSDHCSGLRHSIISNPKQFHLHINALVQNSPAKDLNKFYELKEHGIITDNEYNIIKLGYITNHHLS
jgi:hypothetical protein